MNLTGDIPVGILRGCVNSYISTLTKIFNTWLERGHFPNQLKLAEVTPIFQKEDKLTKENYCPVSVLFQASKIFERIVFNQMNLFFEFKFLPFSTGFRKKPQHAKCLTKYDREMETWSWKRRKGWYYVYGSI